MRLTLFLPGSLVPSEFTADLLTSLDAPALSDRLARSELASEFAAAEPVRGAAHLDWLATALFRSKPPAPTAPYAWAAATGSAADRQIWHADPIYLELAGDHLIAQRLDSHPADEDEAGPLLAVANELADPVGCRFSRADHHWFLQTEQPWSIETVPLDVVSGDSVTAHLPRGRDAGHWGRLLNEIQMAWHAHEINERREASGRPTINSLWLHGGGIWQSLPSIRYTQVQAEAPAWRGAAMAAGVPAIPPGSTPIDNALLIWDDAFAPAKRFDRHAWLAAMTAIDRRLAALGKRHSIDLVLAGRDKLRLLRARPSARWLQWQRLAVPAVLTE
jgi:hypothetical protein